MTSRGKLWKVLLGVTRVDAQEYIELVGKKKSGQYDKIRSDSFRTFPQSKVFRDAVSENSIIRLLNSFVWDNGRSDIQLLIVTVLILLVVEPDEFRYLQGMNLVGATFLYSMPELDAYYSFCKFVKFVTPMYWKPEMYGARAGCTVCIAG